VSDARLLCPNIEIVEARPGLYRALHLHIVAAAELIGPVHEVLSVDEMVIC
jgi:DNA polymerase-4